jgi:catalase
VRYVWRPAGGTPVKARPARTPHGVYDHLQAQLAIGPIRFALEVQIAGPGDDPHDPSAVWRSKERITAGILEIAGPDPARQSADAKGQVFVFDPGKLTDGIEASDDPILAYRIAAYSESAHRRSQPMR